MPHRTELLSGHWALIFQGAVIGEASRISAGAMVHLNTILPAQTRVGLRPIAVPTANGPLITADVNAAREQLATADFFGTVFLDQGHDQEALQAQVIATLLQEVFSWHDDVL